MRDTKLAPMTPYEALTESFDTKALRMPLPADLEAVRVDIALSTDGKWQVHTGHVVFLKEGASLNLSGDVVKESA